LALRAYEVQIEDVNGHAPSSTMRAPTDGDTLAIALPRDPVERAHGYQRVDVRVQWQTPAVPTPAQFHVRRDDPGALRLVGVVH
jgi:hypothetical protein